MSSSATPAARQSVTLDGLSGLMAKKPEQAQGTYFKLVMSGGRVSELHEIWRP